MKRHHLTLLFPLFAILATAQPQATPLQAGQSPEGLVYFLPKTSLQFHILVEKTTYQPGQFARYASRYLHQDGIGLDATTSHRIVGIEVTQLGVRDTSKCYTVKLKGPLWETADVRLTSDGILQAVNAEPVKPLIRAPFTPAPQRPAVNPKSALSAEVLSAGSTAKMASLTVRQMEGLQERRQLLITGEADDMPKDERQLQLMIDEIDRQQQLLMTLFTGTVHRDTTEHLLTLCPDREIQQDVLFRVSQRLGLVDKDDLAGVPYYISITDLDQLRQKYVAPLNKKLDGFYFNVPGRIRLTIHREQDLVADFTLPMAQFGFDELRSSALFKRYITHLTLHPATGAVERITYSEKEK